MLLFTPNPKREFLTPEHFWDDSDVHGVPEYWTWGFCQGTYAPPDCCARYLMELIVIEDLEKFADMTTFGEERSYAWMHFASTAARDEFIAGFNKLMDREWEEWRSEGQRELGLFDRIRSKLIAFHLRLKSFLKRLGRPPAQSDRPGSR
jgi:hypothetical protein